MSNKQLAKNFAEGATKGKGSNMFIEGNKIYSYGYHFVIAERTEQGFKLTTSRYSSSRQRQISHVRNAVYDKTMNVELVENLK